MICVKYILTIIVYNSTAITMAVYLFSCLLRSLNYSEDSIYMASSAWGTFIMHAFPKGDTLPL